MRRLSLTLPAALLLALPAVAQEAPHDPIPGANKFLTGQTDGPPRALLLALPAVAQESLHDPIPWANKFFTGKTDAAPPVILKDFGALPKGTVRTYQFQMTNIYAVTMHLREPRASCGCVSVKEYTGAMKPRETGHILIEVNTGNFDGFKSVKLPVTFEGRDPRSGEPFFSTAQLEVRVVSQRDITFEPGAVAFGVVPA